MASGHGTHTASTAAGNAVKDVSFYGLAQGTARGVPAARIAAYIVCTARGCKAHDILAAFDDAIADGVNTITISISVGSVQEFYGDPVAIGAFHAMEKGILTANSAGNTGPSANTVSSLAPWILTVAASSIDRWIIDEVVFGNGTTVLVSSISLIQYNIMSGTSMSCPHTAGVAAYVKSFHPDWSPAAIKSSLMTTALPMNDTNSNVLSGEFGYASEHINPASAIDPGLVYDAFKEDYINLLCSIYDEGKVRLVSGDNSTCPTGDKGSPKDHNYPSIADPF